MQKAPEFWVCIRVGENCFRQVCSIKKRLSRDDFRDGKRHQLLETIQSLKPEYMTTEALGPSVKRSTLCEITTSIGCPLFGKAS